MSIYIQSSAELSLFIKKLSACSGVPQSPIGRALSSLYGFYSITEYKDLLDNSLKQRARDDIHRALCFLYDNNLAPEDVHQHVETIAPSTYPTLSALREALTNATGDPALTKSILPFEPNDRFAWSAGFTIAEHAPKDAPDYCTCMLCRASPVYKQSPENTRSAALISGMSVHVKPTCTHCHPIVNMDTSEEAKHLNVFSLNPSFSQGNISALLFKYERLLHVDSKEMDTDESAVLNVLSVFFDDICKQFAALQKLMGGGFVQALFAIRKHLSEEYGSLEPAKLEHSVDAFQSCMTVIDGRRLGVLPAGYDKHLAITDKVSLDRAAKALSKHTGPGREKWKSIIASIAGFNKVASFIRAFSSSGDVNHTFLPAFSDYMSEAPYAYVSEHAHKYMVTNLTMEDDDIETAKTRAMHAAALMSEFINNSMLDHLEARSPGSPERLREIFVNNGCKHNHIVDYQMMMSPSSDAHTSLLFRAGSDDGMEFLWYMLNEPEIFVGISELESIIKSYLAFRSSLVLVTGSFMGGKVSLSALRYYVENYAKSRSVTDVFLSQFTPYLSDADMDKITEKIHTLSCVVEA